MTDLTLAISSENPGSPTSGPTHGHQEQGEGSPLQTRDRNSHKPQRGGRLPRGVPDQRTFRDPTNPRRLDSNESERRRAGQLRQHMQPSLDRPESSSSSQPLARENPDDAVSIVQASDQRVGTTNGEQDNDAGPRQPQHEAIDHMSADIAIGAGAEEEYAQPENLDVDPKRSNEHIRGRPSPRRGYYRSEQQRRRADQQELRELKSKIEALESEKHRNEIQIHRMSELIDSLHRRGLPRADDDDYFIREVKEALSEIREWSRLMCRGSSSTSAEDFRQFYSHFKDILVASIDGVEKIVEGSEEIPGKLKTRCVEVVLYRTLLEKYLLGDTIIGLSSLSKERMEQLKNDMSVEQPQNDMSVSEEDYHYWNALSIHLLTAGNVQHEEQQHLEVEKVINSLKERLSPIGAPGKASFMTLRRLLTRIAQLGLKIAVLRYKFQWMDIQLGDIFHAKTMREIESSSDENDGVLEIENRPIKIILCPALGKSKFDSDGKLEEPVLMAKSLVSCVEM